MQIQLTINNYTYEIDSRNPETIARWLGEMFTINWMPADHVQVSVYPTWDAEKQTADWIRNTEWLLPLDSGNTIESPRDFVNALTDVLNRYEADHAK
jgi:hypothetical protein